MNVIVSVMLGNRCVIDKIEFRYRNFVAFVPESSKNHFCNLTENFLLSKLSYSGETDYCIIMTGERCRWNLVIINVVCIIHMYFQSNYYLPDSLTRCDPEIIICITDSVTVYTWIILNRLFKAISTAFNAEASEIQIQSESFKV